MLRRIASLLCIILLLSTLVLDVRGRNIVANKVTMETRSSRGKQTARISMDPLFRNIKRSVPNGPDPIHNRRAGKAGRPPGRA